MILDIQNYPPIQASAILFDLDGTLVESTEGISAILSAWAIQIGQCAQKVVDFSHGKRTIEIVQEFVNAEYVQEHYYKLTQQFIQSADQTKTIQGSNDFLNQLIKKKILWAIVSSSERLLIKARLKAAGLPLPDQIISAEDVQVGKPSPEGYLLAAKKLGVKIQDCIVFEDAEAGVLAAQHAKAQIVIVGSLEQGLTTIRNYTEIVCIGG